MEALHALVPEGYVDGSLNEKILKDQVDRNTVQEAMISGKYQPWDYQPFFNASKQYRRDLLKPCKMKKIDPKILENLIWGCTVNKDDERDRF